MSRVSPCFLPILLLVAAAPFPAGANDYEAAANAVCKCQEQPHQKSKDMAAAIRTAQQTGNFSEMTRIQGELLAISKEVEACYAKLSEQFPEIAKSEEEIDKVNDMAEKMCPNPAKEIWGGS